MNKPTDSVTKYIMAKIADDLMERCSTPEEIVEATLAPLMVQKIFEAENIDEV